MRKDKENPTLEEQLQELLDDAVTEGRQNWDGYYNNQSAWNPTFENQYHMDSILQSDKYQAFVKRLKALGVAHIRRF